MSNEEKIVVELVNNALYRMDESTRMIQKSLDDITEDELWLKPNESLNSIANLMLQLCGNITQYIISSLGEADDIRNRDLEFTTSKSGTKSEILKKLEETVNEAKRVIFDASINQLLEVRSVQGFSFSGVGCYPHHQKRLLVYSIH